MYTLGKATKTTFLHIDRSNTSQEFEASAAVNVGQPVKLDADGKVQPWTKADLQHKLVGYAYNEATAAGQLITVIVRGFAIIYALSNAAADAGPASLQAYDADTEVGGVKGYSKYDNAAGAAAGDVADETHAWILDQAAGADVLIRVLLKN